MPVVLTGLADETDGSVCSGFSVSKFGVSGNPFSGFGLDGRVLSPTECEPRTTLADLGGGDLFVAGPRTFGSACLEAQKLLSDGSTFQGWSQGGNPGASRFCYSSGKGPAGVGALASDVDGRGRIIVGGGARWGKNQLFGTVRRIRPDGTTDKTFRGTGSGWAGEAGLVRFFEKGAHYNVVESVKSLRNGDILAGGTNRGAFAVARINADGSTDRKFGSGSGLVRVDPDGRKCEAAGFTATSCVASAAADMTVDGHGRIVIAGTTSKYSSGGAIRDSRLSIARVKSDGTRDKSFSKNAIAKPAVGHFKTSSVAIQRDGRILVAGQSRGKFRLVRLSRFGSLDKSFFGDGMLTATELGSSAIAARDVTVDAQGRILVLGELQFGGFELNRLLPR